MARSNWKGTSGWSAINDPTGVLSGKVLLVTSGVGATTEDYLMQIQNTTETFQQDHGSIIMNYAFPKTNGIHPLSNGKFGLIARASNFQTGNTLAQDCYIGLVDLSEGSISIIRRNSGVETVLKEVDVPSDSVSTGIRHVIEFRCYGTTTVTLQVYIDNTLFVTFGDDSTNLLSLGKPGITVDSGSVYVDNFTFVAYTVAGGSASMWTPDNATSATLSGWYKSDVTSLTAGTNLLDMWDDNAQSGSEISPRSFSLVTGTTQATVLKNQLMGKDVIQFSLSASEYEASDGSHFDLSTDCSIFCVINPVSFPSGSTPSTRVILNKGENYNLHITTANVLSFKTDSSFSENPVSLNAFQLVGVISNETFYIDGIGRGSTGAMGATNSNTLKTAPDNSLICEIVLYDGKLSTTDRQKLEGYLAHRWNTSERLASNHPYKLYAPLQ